MTPEEKRRIEQSDLEDRWNNPMKEENERIIPRKSPYIPSLGVADNPSPRKKKWRSNNDI